ncbi:alpha/beta fold hydrolase [Oricola cellulosilytica]|nr:alpha/beta hydrolase [Oricola cellulosilytica]
MSGKSGVTCPPVPVWNSAVPVRSYGNSEKPVGSVLLHGVVSSISLWRTLIRSMPRERFLALPLPGHHPWTTDATETARLLKDFGFIESYRDAILAHAHGSVHLIAHSTGAIAALKLAARYPEVVSRLTLLGAFPCGRNAVARSPMARGVIAPLIGAPLFSTLFKIWLNSESTYRYGLSTAMAADAQSEASGRDRSMMWDLRRSDPEALRQVVAWLSKTSVTSELPRIDTPVTVVVSQNDRVVDPKDQLTLLRELRNANAVLCNAGHLPMIETPELLRNLIQPSGEINRHAPEVEPLDPRGRDIADLIGQLGRSLQPAPGRVSVPCG